MPINSLHPEYKEHCDTWCKCRDVVEGEDAVKEGGNKYLPQLGGQEQIEYNAYRTRASFYGATGRTVKGLAGAVVRKPPETKVPTAMDDVLTRLGVEGAPLNILTKKSIEEVLTTGRLGIMVDAPEVENGEPFVALYCAESVINWESASIPVEGTVKQSLTLVVLKEERLVSDPEDRFKKKCEDIYRVLELVNGKYQVSRWRETDEKDQQGQPVFERVGDVVTPTKRGGLPFDYIPFLLVTPLGVSDRIDKSPVLDMANTSLSLYRNSADREHGLHFTALPQAYLCGFELKSGEKLRIGSSEAWVTDNAAAKAGYLEYSGAGLSSIKDAMEEKKTELAVLGSRLLEEQKKQTEAATTVLLRQSGEQSVLANVADSVGSAWEQVLEWLAEWLGLDGSEVTFAFNKTFVSFPIDAPTLAQMMAATQGGLMSWASFFYNIKRAEMVPDNVDEEEERVRIETGPPMGFPTVPLPVKGAGGQPSPAPTPPSPAPGGPKPAPTPAPKPAAPPAAP